MKTPDPPEVPVLTQRRGGGVRGTQRKTRNPLRTIPPPVPILPREVGTPRLRCRRNRSKLRQIVAMHSPCHRPFFYGFTGLITEPLKISWNIPRNLRKRHVSRDQNSQHSPQMPSVLRSCPLVFTPFSRIAIFATLHRAFSLRGIARFSRGCLRHFGPPTLPVPARSRR